MSSHENLFNALALPNLFFRGFTDPAEINNANLQNHLDAHRMATFTVNEKRRSIPDFEDLEKAEAEPEDELTVINQKMKMLGENHLKDLERLYTIQAIDYLADNQNQYLAFDESELENLESSVLEELRTNDAVRDFSIENTWGNEYNHTRYVYVSQLVVLQKRRHQIMAQRERQQKEFERQFPQTKEEFENKPNDMQIRVARFLVAEKTQKEKLLAEFDWAWRQTEPLEKIFKTDPLFASEVRSMMLSVVQTSRDPRRL